MFESSYASMHKKIKKHFKDQPLSQLDSNDKAALKELLHSAVTSAMNAYKKGPISENRKKDIEVIDLIFTHYHSVEECHKKLERYFSGKPVDSIFNSEVSIPERLKGHQFKTGLMDGSKLEDYVVATVDTFYEHIIQPLLFESKAREHIDEIKSSLHQCLKNAKYHALHHGANNEEIGVEYETLKNRIKAIKNEEDLNSVLNDVRNSNPKKNSLHSFFQKNIQPILDKNIRFNEKYSKKIIQYEFKDFLNFYLDKYQQKRGTKQGKPYDHDQDIIEFLHQNPDPTLGNLADKLMSPLLKKHLINAHDEFRSQIDLERQVKIKTWEKEQPAHPESPKKIIIAVHGWRDSVECWNNLGQAAIEKGYKVIAYDHRGYGFDDERKNIGHNNDYLALDFRKFVQSVIADNPGAEINLVGHSMGGAILLNCQDFIEKQPEIKAVTCFSPAVTPSLPSLFSEFRNALLGRNAHEEVLDRLHNNQPRFVQASLLHPANILKIITTLPSLLSMMTQAYQSLQSLVSKQPQQESKPWTILYGEKDKAVPFSAFEEVQENQINNRVSFKGFPRGDHLLSQGRHATAALDTFFEVIEPRKSDSDQDNFDDRESLSKSL